MGANTSQFIRGPKEGGAVTVEQKKIRERDEYMRDHFLERVQKKNVPYPKLFSTKERPLLRSDNNFYPNVSFDKFNEKFKRNPHGGFEEDYFLHEIRKSFQNYLDSNDERFASTRVSMLLHS